MILGPVAQLLTAQAALADGQSGAMAGIRQQINRFDAASLGYALDGLLTPEEIADIGRSVTLAEQTLGGAVALTDPAYMQTVNAAAKALAKRTCSSLGGKGDGIIPGNEDGNWTPAIREAVAKQVPAAFGVLGLALGSVFAAGALAHYRQLLRKRYTCKLEVAVSYDRQEAVMRLVDISRHGAKLSAPKPDSDALPAQITVTMEGITRPAAIVWRNNHYCGLKFNRALRLRELSSLLGGSAAEQVRNQRNRHPETTNGTPKGAAVSNP